MLRDAQLHPDVALVNGISVLLTLLEVRKGRYGQVLAQDNVHYVPYYSPIPTPPTPQMLHLEKFESMIIEWKDIGQIES